MTNVSYAKYRQDRAGAPLRTAVEDAVGQMALMALVAHTFQPVPIVGKVLFAVAAAGSAVSISSAFLANYGDRSKAKAALRREERGGAGGAVEGLDVTGPLSQKDGRFWFVYETPDAYPKVMSEKEYEEYRDDAPDLTQVDIAGGRMTVSRLSYGAVDSLRSGKPSVETRDLDGTLVSVEWHLYGKRAEPARVMAAMAQRDLEAASAPDTAHPAPGL